MIKFTAPLRGVDGTLFGFGLSKGNLERLEKNQPILFDFGYAGRPKDVGLIIYMGDKETTEDITPDYVAYMVEPIMVNHPELVNRTQYDLMAFPIPRTTFQKLWDTPGYSYERHIPIASKHDKQLIFSGDTEESIMENLRNTNLMGKDSKIIHQKKGFG